MKAITRRSAIIALGGFGTGLVGTTAIGASWLRDDRQPSLTALGSGRGLSVLLTSGGARLLLLGGTDYTDFGNALSSARFPMLDRIDLVLAPGRSPNLQLVEHALRQTDARAIYSIGHADELLDAGIAIARSLTTPHTFALPGETKITFSLVNEQDSSELAWSMLVRWRTHRLLIDSGGAIDTLRLGVHGVSAWIRASGALTTEELQQIEPASVFIAAEAMNGATLRGVLRESGRRVYGYRVHGGDIARLELASGGLQLPGSPANDLLAGAG